MGIANKFSNAISYGFNQIDPLFGGLIPRREVITAPVDETGVTRQTNNISRGALNRQQPGINNKLQQETPFGNREVRFVADPDKAFRLERDRLDFEKDKFAYAKDQFNSEMQLKQAKQYNDDVQLDINHRKQALEEWKARNPEGKIQVDKNGRVHIINPIDGSSVDTGLTSNDVSDEQKHLWKMEEDKETQDRIDKRNKYTQDQITKRNKQNNIKGISPTQQRAAEHDALMELVNTKYPSLKDQLEFNSDGTIVLNNKKGDLNKAKQFEGVLNEAKEIAKKRINAYTGGGTVTMYTPDGRELDVPEDKVDEMKANGAVFELPTKKEEKKELPAKKEDTTFPFNIEIIKDSSGRVVGVANKPRNSDK